MDYGIPTLIELRNVEECAALCRELGFDFVELNMNLPEYQADQIDIEELRDVAVQYGIYYTLHLDENLNVCDFNPLVANAWIDTVSAAVDLAKQLNIPVLNMHMPRGVHFTLPDRSVYLFSQYEDIYLQRLKQFQDLCAEMIGSADLRICIENIDSYLPFEQRGIDLLLESSFFGLTYDIGHAAGKHEQMNNFIFSRRNKLHHMHIHDAAKSETGEWKNHLLLGNGQINLQKYLDMAIEHNCRAVIEVKAIKELYQSTVWLRANNFIKQTN